jgi:VIT1/CCC1 family predicted Fe2+/Mn2+ transporter
MNAEAAAERSLGQLFRDLTAQAYTLIRQELELAKTEANERVSALMADAAWIGAGALLLHVGLGTAVAAIVLALAQAGLPLPAAAALVAVVLMVIAAFIVQSRLAAIRRRRLIPTRTVHSLKETGQWLKDQTT